MCNSVFLSIICYHALLKRIDCWFYFLLENLLDKSWECLSTNIDCYFCTNLLVNCIFSTVLLKRLKKNFVFSLWFLYTNAKDCQLIMMIRDRTLSVKLNIGCCLCLLQKIKIKNKILMYSWQLLKHFVSLKISSVDKGLSHRQKIKYQKRK